MEKPIKDIISCILNKPISDSKKLEALNKNLQLNKHLNNGNANKIVEAIIEIIEEKLESDVNINILKFYLHEINLIFNLYIDSEYFKGTVY